MFTRKRYLSDTDQRVDYIKFLLFYIFIGIFIVGFSSTTVKAASLADVSELTDPLAQVAPSSNLLLTNEIISNGSIVNSGVNGTATWDIDSAGTLTVHAGKLAYGKGNWSAYASSIKNVYVEPGVLPFSSIMTTDSNNGVFSELPNVVTIDVTNLDVSKVRSLGYMFSEDPKLTQIIGLDTWDTSNTVSMSSMFYRDTALTALDLSAWDTSELSRTGWMFYLCSGLQSLNISGFDTSHVSDPRYMFSGVGGKITGLADLDFQNTPVLDGVLQGVDFTKTDPNDIKDWNVSNCTSMAYLFASTKFTALDLSKWDMQKVTNMSGMFSGSSGNLSQVKDIANWDTSKVTNMSNMFQNTQATDLSFINNWNVEQVVSMGFMFNGCSKLAALDLSNWTTNSLEITTSMFNGAKLLNETTLKGYQTLVTNKTTNTSAMFASTSFETIDLSKYDTSNVTNFSFMFSGDSKLTKIIGNFDTHSLTNMQSMFTNTGVIDFSEINIADWDTSKVTTMQGTFSGSKITDYGFLENWKTPSLTNLNSTFRQTVGTSLPISKWDTSKVTTFYYVFNNMASLETLDLSNLDTTNATNLISMFGDTNKLWKLKLGPKSLLFNNGAGSYPPSPQAGAEINDDGNTYFAISTKWQEVRADLGGTDHQPLGDLFSNTQIQDKFSTAGNPVTTFVWQQQVQTNIGLDVSNIDFGTTHSAAGIVQRKGDFSISINNESYPEIPLNTTLNVRMLSPLTNTSDPTKTVNNVLIFKNTDDQEETLSTSATEVYSGAIDSGAQVLNWNDRQGILLNMENAESVSDGRYSTTLEWELISSL